MHSKCDNMHKNDIFYTLICINNHEITSISCMLSIHRLISLIGSFCTKFLVNLIPKWFMTFSKIKQG